MASGKRASMREGPLAALFRRTDEEEPGRPPSARAPAARGPAPRAAQPRPRRPPRPGSRSAARRSRRRTASPQPQREAPQRGSARGAGGPRGAAHPRDTGYPHPSLGADAGAGRDEQPRLPTPQERLRHAFSTDIPEDMLRAPADEPCDEPAHDVRAAPTSRRRGARRARSASPSCASSASAAPASTPSTAWSRPRSRASSSSRSTPTCSRCSSRRRTSRCTSGPPITRGLGAGSNPDLGRAAAMDEYDRIKSLLKGSDMIFIAAGAGGGTGTGAAPIVARIAREIGALTVGIVTKPFGFEGQRRRDGRRRWHRARSATRSTR